MHPFHYFDWLGNLLICAGLWYQAGKKWWAFLLIFLGEVAWIIYGLPRHLYSMVVLCIILAAIAVRGMVIWRKTQ
jgi:hypothetical protein